MTHDPSPNTIEYAIAPPGRSGLLSDALEEVRHHAADGSITVGEAVEVLRERGIAMVMAVLTLPFLIPVPLLGLSTPIGGMIAFFGLCLVCRRKPWLPGWIRRRSMSPQFVDRLASFGGKWARRFEYFMRPRLKFMTWPVADTLIGVAMIISSLFLALPLPIPFSNAVPAISILLLLLGLIERDGVFVIVGQFISLVLLGVMSCVVYLIVAYGLGETWQMIESWLGHAAATQPS